jgi:hypothetical protein
MRRLTVALLAVVVLVGGVLLRGSVLAAKEPEATDYTGHPLVGAWWVDTDLESTDDPPSLVSFSADGTLLEVGADGTTWVGVWAPTGAATGEVALSTVDAQGASSRSGRAWRWPPMGGR